jgi:ribosome-binding ATPase YchF (GTP1/OBG family)
MELSKEIIECFEDIHKMGREELVATYGDMILIDATEDIDEVKLELDYLIYAVLRKEPDKFERDKIPRYFRYLEMNNELKAYSHSKSTQRIIRRIYRMQ